VCWGRLWGAGAGAAAGFGAWGSAVVHLSNSEQYEVLCLQELILATRLAAASGKRTSQGPCLQADALLHNRGHVSVAVVVGVALVA
jgi:hypothetical protein